MDDNDWIIPVAAAGLIPFIYQQLFKHGFFDDPRPIGRSGTQGIQLARLWRAGIIERLAPNDDVGVNGRAIRYVFTPQGRRWAAHELRRLGPPIPPADPSTSPPGRRTR